jgi:hypothetical protein
VTKATLKHESQTGEELQHLTTIASGGNRVLLRYLENGPELCRSFVIREPLQRNLFSISLSSSPRIPSCADGRQTAGPDDLPASLNPSGLAHALSDSNVSDFYPNLVFEHNKFHLDLTNRQIAHFTGFANAPAALGRRPPARCSDRSRSSTSTPRSAGLAMSSGIHRHGDDRDRRECHERRAAAEAAVGNAVPEILSCLLFSSLRIRSLLKGRCSSLSLGRS